MKNLEIEELYSIYSGETCGVCTDTRNIIPGSMFFALRGETFNGNDFALAAIEGGAAYAVVDDTLAMIWGWPYTEQIGASLTAIITCGCALLGFSSVKYQKKIGGE